MGDGRGRRGLAPPPIFSTPAPAIRAASPEPRALCPIRHRRLTHRRGRTHPVLQVTCGPSVAAATLFWPTAWIWPCRRSPVSRAEGTRGTRGWVWSIWPPAAPPSLPRWSPTCSRGLSSAMTNQRARRNRVPERSAGPAYTANCSSGAEPVLLEVVFTPTHPPPVPAPPPVPQDLIRAAARLGRSLHLTDLAHNSPSAKLLR